MQLRGWWRVVRGRSVREVAPGSCLEEAEFHGLDVREHGSPSCCEPGAVVVRPRISPMGAGAQLVRRAARMQLKVGCWVGHAGDPRVGIGAPG